MAKQKKPVRVTITGAAGQIGYQLAFQIGRASCRERATSPV